MALNLKSEHPPLKMAGQTPIPSQSDGGGGEPITDYEKQRQARIRSNIARMAALGLPTSSRHPSSIASKNKNKKLKTSFQDDDEYIPDQEEDDDASSSSTQEDEPPQLEGKSGRLHSKYPTKKTLIKSRNSCQDADEALQQAVALSLEGNSNEADVILSRNCNKHEIKEDNSKESARRKKTGRKMKTDSRMQLMEDEMVAYFFSFDETGKGFITIRDLEKMAIVHDFVWTDDEMADMISCFDSNGNGKLSLEDFRIIVIKCNLLRCP